MDGEYELGADGSAEGATLLVLLLPLLLLLLLLLPLALPAVWPPSPPVLDSACCRLGWGDEKDEGIAEGGMTPSAATTCELAMPAARVHRNMGIMVALRGRVLAAAADADEEKEDAAWERRDDLWALGASSLE